MTKQIFTILCWVILIQTGQSQMLVRENRQWNIVAYSISSPDIHTCSVKFEGDSIIGAYTYKKIWYSCDSTTQQWTHYSSLIREDSSGKVFMSVGAGEDYLQYDFGANIGDTIMLFDWSPCSVRLESIDSVTLLNGAVRKRWNYKIGNANYYERAIEGIGYLTGVDKRIESCQTDYPYALLCYFENGELLYRAPGTNSCFITPTSEPSIADQIKIGPNPFSDHLLVNLPASLTNIQWILYDYLGREVKREQLQSGQNDIVTDQVPTGLYFWELSAGAVSLKRGKIVKEE
jgi:Secretion system C-terminal sorting domain